MVHHTASLFISSFIHSFIHSLLLFIIEGDPISQIAMPATRKIKKWSIDLTLNENDVGYGSLEVCPLGMKKIAAIERQLQSKANKQFSTTELSPKEKQRAATLVQRKGQMAMSLATSPGKSIMMSAFMMYMSGSNLNMWSINTISMAIMTPLTNLFGMNKQFAKFEDADGKVDLQMRKLIFVALNLVWLLVGLYKMSKMRLLPTYSSDWSGRIVWKEMMEMSSVPPS